VDDRERLEAIIKVVRQYLPPGGIYGKEAMGKIIELVDPLPPKREWVGLTDEDLEPMCDDWRIIFGPYVHDFTKAIEAKLKEKNT
jgi:hypothetical protein